MRTTLASLISSVFSIYLIFIFIIRILAQIRRLHGSGFLCLLNLLPVVGNISLLIVLMLSTNFSYKYHDYR
ncbi:DUF805 domain-containing protein [Lactiplantibacillus herbarum]|uniref:DUF805 domain-containing protein n=1 Tax=Lactiplantibacillus herbarum TaxID=1670446 RepID=UPI003B50CB07